MNSHSFEILNPSSKAPRTEQYEVAWRLLGDAAANPSDRHHAKCWLTYRAIEEAPDCVTYQDWQKHVENTLIPLPPEQDLRARWNISQATAELYLGILHDPKLAIRAEHDLLEAVQYGCLKLWPAGSLNVLRAWCLRVYRRYLAGEHVVPEIQQVFAEWARQFSTPPPFRWCEVMDAAPVLKALAYMAQQQEAIIPGGISSHHPYTGVSPASRLPWVLCMYRLGAHHARALWVPPALQEGRLVQQYRVIHATKRYGPGGLKPEWIEVYKRLTRNLEVRTVLDYGCGRSRDIESLWPQAYHGFYDPAIPGIDKLPERSFSLGYCTQVMEHIPEEEVEETFRRMLKLSPWWVFSIHKRPANQILPNGENAHCTQRNEMWWAGEAQAVFGGKIHTEPMSEACFYMTNIPQ